MMLDRMFLAEEQQSLLRLRQEVEEQPPPVAVQFASPPPPSQQQQQQRKCPTPSPSTSHHQQEEYDEWACIQREIGSLSTASDAQQQSTSEDNRQPPKRSASSDSRLETLKRFRVEKHNKQRCSSGTESASNNSLLASTTATNTSYDENNSIDEQVQSAIDSILNLQQNTCLDLDDAVSSILS